MNSDYRIEKDRLSVVVTTVGGERLTGDLFVQTYTRHRSGREQAPDVMNDADPFFPLATKESGTLLVAKDNVRDVDIANDPDEDAEALGVRSEEIQVILTGGVVHVGGIYLEVPLDRPRLLDYLNRVHDRFLTLHTAAGVRLVNRRLIESVRPLD